MRKVKDGYSGLPFESFFKSELSCQGSLRMDWKQRREPQRHFSWSSRSSKINLFLALSSETGFMLIFFIQTNKLLDKTGLLRIYETENTDNTLGNHLFCWFKYYSCLQIFPNESMDPMHCNALRSILIRFQLMVLFGDTFPFATRLIFSNIWCSKGAAGRRGQGEHS